MLVLSRKINESVVIDGGIEITVVDIRGDKVRLDQFTGKGSFRFFSCNSKGGG